MTKERVTERIKLYIRFVVVAPDVVASLSLSLLLLLLLCFALKIP